MDTFDNHRKKGERLVETLLAEGKTCFSLDDARKKLKIARQPAKLILSRLQRKKKIISLSSGFYAYFPPSEKKSGFDVSKVLDAVMRRWKVPYYVGLLSAADYYGAAHYKPQVLQIVIPKMICFRKAKSLGLEFHVQKHFPKSGITKIKTPSGFISYATPELLVLDLLAYEKAAGGLDNAALVIKEILPRLKGKDLQSVALEYPVMSAVQRLGFVLESLEIGDALQKVLQRVMKKRGASVVRFSSVLPKTGKFDPKWQIIKNTVLELGDDF